MPRNSEVAKTGILKAKRTVRYTTLDLINFWTRDPQYDRLDLIESLRPNKQIVECVYLLANVWCPQTNYIQRNSREKQPQNATTPNAACISLIAYNNKSYSKRPVQTVWFFFFILFSLPSAYPFMFCDCLV